MRGARPDIGSRFDPLPFRAEAELDAIVARSTIDRPLRWRVPALAVSGLAGALAILFTAVSVFHAPQASMAAPPALEFAATEESVGHLMSRLSSAAESLPGASGSAERIDYEAWYSEVIVDEDHAVHYVQPYTVSRVRNADFSGSQTTWAGDIRWGTVPADDDADEPGTLLEELTFNAGEFPLVYTTPPPRSASSLRDYFQAVLGDSPSTGDYFRAIHDLSLEWVLDGPQMAAVYELVAELPDVTVAGTTTDRLGRAGVGIETATRVGFRDVLIFDENTGGLLSAEETYLGGLDWLKNTPSPTVFSYVSWKELY
ncbi:hypothetical protein D7I47_02350 [Protaetiibacter intestinalis]|uniref:CU044_5270 family protein n=1 Tax=Protaetiibacter intestinalis TaxID=2419774 RepID=A0A387B121_9MICO|nr:hypothetical protein D7I47_02350 [Protaetiibacter intestinalis]